MGISRDHWHKRRATGGKRKPLRKKRKFELGRPAANTKLGAQRIHTVRTRGGNKKYRFQTEAEEEALNKKRSKKCEAKYKARQRFAKVEPALEEQFATGRVLACVASRPGQCGRADGYILEGKELEFYMRKIKSKKAK
ncbi:40S ribosomal protein S8 [Fopius arisanus]|uniref:40S ribosomal protein S8 n=1 Tax=Fopius arisanus TaxID=64838 RepID=A0A9R1TCK5_9HYME|nr:PREDICTED: 40S ribosomal protein S8 [Fopius arisanus]